MQETFDDNRFIQIAPFKKTAKKKSGRSSVLSKIEITSGLTTRNGLVDNNGNEAMTVTSNVGGRSSPMGELSAAEIINTMRDTE